MMNDYKKNLMKWLTGNLEIGSGSGSVQQVGTTTNENALTEYLTNNYTTTNCIVIKNIKSTINSNMLSLLYDRDHGRSIIIIFDETLNPIKLLTGYSSGTQFAHILGINVGEDGEFFLIENTGTTIRFVMCNNITVGDVNGNYQVILKKSYNVGGNLTNLVDVSEIIKYPNQSKYLVLGTDNDMTPNIDIATEIVVQVGVSNEYNDFTFSGAIGMIYGDLYYTSDGESISFKICGTLGSNYIEMSNSGYTIATTTYSIGSGIYTSRVTKTNSNDAYIVAYNNDGSYTFYHFNGSTITQLASESYGDSFKAIRGTLLNINRINGIVYGIILVDFNSSNSNIRGFTIVDDLYDASIISDEISNSNISDSNLLITANSVYDMYNFIYLFGSLTTKSYVVYNESRYNGNAYIDYNYFVPSYSIMSDGTKPIFARGLYNFIVLNESSTAVINIPNSYLNDINFYPSLFGETGGELITSSEYYQKNIYENLLINFNNSLNIFNDEVYMQTPSIRLNQSILSNLDYDNSKLGWVRINYENYTFEQPITLTQQSDYIYEVDFVVQASEDINSIMLLSNDRNTVYDQFIIEYEIGNYYSIQRTIEIN